MACSDKHSSLLQDGIHLIHKSQCVCVCTCARVYIRYRNPNHWTDLNEICHGDTPQWGKGSYLGFDPIPPPLGQGGPKQGLPCLCSLNNCSIWCKFYQTKAVGHPHFSGGGSHFWTHHPDLEGLGTYVFLEQWSINFTHA